MSPTAPIRVAHVITGLQVGGAETMLWQLLKHSDTPERSCIVVTLISGGEIADEITRLGVPVYHLGVRSSLDFGRALWLTRRRLRAFVPHVVQGWMSHANWISALSVVGLPVRPSVCWGIHYTHFDPQTSGRASWLMTKSLPGLARRRVDKIVCCSRAAADARRDEGYPADRLVFQPNGFDTSRFEPSKDRRQAARADLNLGADDLVVGVVANDTPSKDYRNLLEAVKLAKDQAPALRLVACGHGVTLDNPRIGEWTRELGIADHVRFLGPRRDIPEVMNAFDLFTSPSRAEAFPLVVGEAMSCGLPCVVTDVGDSAYLVGNGGMVVPPRDPQRLAAGWIALLGLPPDTRRALGLAARQRILERFDIRAVARSYASLYRSLSPEQP